MFPTRLKEFKSQSDEFPTRSVTIKTQSEGYLLKLFVLNSNFEILLIKLQMLLNKIKFVSFTKKALALKKEGEGHKIVVYLMK